MIKETADVSEHNNWVKTYLQTKGLDVFGIEGYYLTEDSISMFMDRRKVDDVTSYDPDLMYEEFQNQVRGSMVGAKSELSSLSDSHYRVALYDDSKVRVYDMFDDRAELCTKVLDYETFGRWLDMHHVRDSASKSFIHDDELPEIDKKLRELGTPWFGNLDGFWHDGDEVRALIEFQTTIKSKVANHSNNYWFVRGDDEGRWRNLNQLRKAVGKPLIVIVWSPNRDDKKIKVKKLKRVVVDGDDRGLKYYDISLLQKKELIPHLRSIV